MRRLPALTLLLAAFALAACQSPSPDDAPAPAADYDAFGEAVSPEGAVPVQTVLAETDRYVGQDVTVEGTVAEVCQMAGCWLTLQTNDGSGVRIAVARDDEGAYRFTVPKDISGRRVIVAGTLASDTLTAATQQHLDEDAGRDTEGKTYEDQPELRMTARGVLIETV